MPFALAPCVTPSFTFTSELPWDLDRGNRNGVIAGRQQSVMDWGARFLVNLAAMTTTLSREAYFATGLAVLSDLGYGGLKLAEVCNRLGVTSGSFYHYFSN